MLKLHSFTVVSVLNSTVNKFQAILYLIPRKSSVFWLHSMVYANQPMSSICCSYDVLTLWVCIGVRSTMLSSPVLGHLLPIPLFLLCLPTLPVCYHSGTCP